MNVVRKFDLPYVIRTVQPQPEGYFKLIDLSSTQTSHSQLQICGLI